MENYLAKHPVKAFFCNSTFHNPTVGNISAHDASKILRLSVKHGLFVVEDDA